MAREMQLKLVIGADGKAVAPVTAEVRREVESVGEAGRSAASDLGLYTAANDEAAAASRRATEAARGQAQAERDLRASIDRAIGVRPALNDNQYKARQADIAAYGAELDRLRARFVPAAAAEQSLLAIQNQINRAFELGAISAREQAEALEINRLAHDRTAAAAALQAEEYRRLAAAGREAWAADQEQSRINSLLGVAPAGSGKARASADVFADAGMFDRMAEGAGRAAQATGLAAHEVQNLSYQLNDIVMMLMSGQSFGIIMAQQGAQVSQIFGKRGLGEIIPAIGTGLMSLVSPTTMFLAAITAAGYAGYAAYRLIQPAAVDAEAAMERQAKLLEDLTERYGRVGEAAKRATVEGADLFRLRGVISEQELGLLARTEARGFLGSISPEATYDPRKDVVTYTLPSEYREFAAAIEALRESTARGVPDVEEFRRLVSERWGLEPNNDELTKQAKVLLDNTSAMVEYARALMTITAARREATAAQRGALIGSGTEDARNEYFDEQRRMMREAQLSFDAEIASLGARSPAALAAAARRREELRVIKGEGVEARDLRIDLEGRRALAEAEHALAEAQRERGRALNDTLAAARLDLDLVGKSAAEVDRLRMEHQLLAELRREAAQNGVEASQKEVDAIRAVAAETARLRAIAGARELIRDKAEELDQLRIETALVGASSAMRAQLLARLEAEREIRERGIDAMGREAQGIRAANAALAEQQLVLERLQDGWGAVQQAGESMIDNVFDRLIDGDWEGAIKSIADEMLKLSLQLAVTNPLKNAAFGTNYGTLDDLGGFRGIFGRLFGGGDSGAEKALSGLLGSQSVATMTVSAGTVILGDAGGGLLGNVTRLLTGANDNTAAGGGIQQQIWKFFSDKGLAPHQVAGIMGNISAESGFNPSAIGDSGKAFGLFQHWANRGGGEGMLGDVQAQLKLAWQELMTTERRSFEALLKSGNVSEATAAFGGFERPQGFSWGAPEEMHNWTGRLRDAELALQRFGDVTGKTVTGLDVLAGGLGDFGGGMSEMGRNLVNYFPPAPGGGGSGGGIFGWLIGLFGGGGANYGAMSASGRYLFDTGGPTGGSDPSRVAGLVHEKEYVFDAESTRRIGVGNLDAIRRGALKGYREGGYAVTSGASPFGGSGTAGGLTINIQNNAGAKVEVGETKQDAGGGMSVDVLVNELEARMEGSMRGGRLGRAAQQTFGLQRRTR